VHLFTPHIQFIFYPIKNKGFLFLMRDEIRI